MVLRGHSDAAQRAMCVVPTGMPEKPALPITELAC
jgi:hypothetical protein